MSQETTKKQTNWSAIIIILIIALATISLAYWLNSTIRTSEKVVGNKNESVTNRVNEATNDFVVYHDNKYGFSLEHPKAWQVEKEGDKYVIRDTENIDNVHGEKRQVITLALEDVESLEAWFEKNITKLYEAAGLTPDYEDITINNIEGRELPTSISIGGCNRAVAFFKDGKVYHIARDSGTCDYDEQTINQVIESFKLD